MMLNGGYKSREDANETVVERVERMLKLFGHLLKMPDDQHPKKNICVKA